MVGSGNDVLDAGKTDKSGIDERSAVGDENYIVSHGRRLRTIRRKENGRRLREIERVALKAGRIQTVRMA